MTSEILDPKGQFNFETGLPPGFMPIDHALEVLKFREELNADKVDLAAEALGASATKAAITVPAETAPILDLRKIPESPEVLRKSSLNETEEETIKESPGEEFPGEDKELKEPPELVAKPASQDKHEEPEKKSKKKGKGGPSAWWFIPCMDHGEPRWVCCLGGECQRWRM